MYTEEEIKFLKDNYLDYSYKDLTKFYNEKFNHNKQEKTIRIYLNKYLHLRKKEQDYTKEQIEWIRSYFLNHSQTETKLAFNKKFNQNRSVHAINHVVKGIYKTHHFTKEQEDFIVNEAAKKNATWKNVTKNFNTRFNTNLLPHSIKAKGAILGVHTGYNKGFRKSYKYNIGEECLDCATRGKDAAIKVKVSKTDWKLKHVLIYEQAYGPLPAGYRVIFLDGNKRNFALDNLAAVSPSEYKRLGGNRYTSNYFGAGKITLAKLETIRAESVINDFAHII